MSDMHRWEELRDREAAGDPLSSADHSFLREYETRHPHEARETAAWGDVLARLGDGAPSAVPDADVAAAALARARAAEQRRGRGLLVAGAALAMAAAALLWWQAAPVAPDRSPAPVVAAPGAPDPASAPVPPHAAPAEAPPPRLAFSDPAGVLGGTILDDGEPRTVTAGGCFVLEGEAGVIAEVCATDETRLALSRSSAAHTEIALELGKLTSTVHHERAPQGHTFTISTEVASVTAVGTVFTVEVTRDGKILTSVEEGVVEVVQGGGRVHVEAGSERVLHDPDEGASRVVRAPSPATLQSRAEAARAEGRYRAAVDLYGELIKHHPRSPEATVALVAMGDLELDKLGRPRAALRAYDRYLKTPGSLAQEALHGRIRALGKLGRVAEEREAIETYLRRYPNGFHAAQHRARLER